MIDYFASLVPIVVRICMPGPPIVVLNFVLALVTCVPLLVLKAE